MATKTIEKWTPYGVALDITATSGTVTRTSATQFTVALTVSWETYYSGAKTNYGMKATAGSKSVTISSFGTSRSSGSNTVTGTYSISGNGAQTKEISIVFENFNTDKNQSAKKTVTLNISVPALTSYTVSYNANGGSGAPGSQTKWKDQKLTLSSTKPTKTGHTFQGWATSASGSVAYAAGASYTANANVTLYAIWKANTYTVTYNANGGTNVPANQTKTYGTALTLTSSKPTRTNFTFKGWGLSAAATTVAYASGASYTKNEAITLYAIWDLAYTKPRINKLSVTRCDASGNAINDGAYALLKFSWECDVNATSIYYKFIVGDSIDGDTVSITGRTGNFEEIIGGSFNATTSYDILVRVTDENDSYSKTVTLNSRKFPIQVMPREKGIAFGKNAELEGYADFGFKIKSSNDAIFAHDKNIFGTDANGTEYAALMPLTASGNTSLGYGLYSAEKGNTHIYGNKVQFYTKGGIYANSNPFVFDNNNVIRGIETSGAEVNVFQPKNSSNNTVLGYGNYDNESGLTNIYGHDINFGVSNIATKGTYKPYYRKGDTVSVALYTSGFCTDSKTEVHFHVPLTKPIVGSPTVAAASDEGFIFRQNNTYTHGSTATVYVTPSKYSAYAYHGVGVRIIAEFSTTTNAVNNSPIGIVWRGTITFS